MSDFKRGLLPICGDNPIILILGSFPSLISLEKSEYYGNKRNHFWKIMKEVFGIDENLQYEERINSLKNKGIALWDVACECKREGSSDITIKDIIPTDLISFVKKHKTIRVVALNGKTGAGKLFRKFNNDFSRLFPEINVIVLPSSSPANALYSPEEKINQWYILKNYL